MVGRPASGKSTLVTQLTARWDLPVVAKDALKEALFDSLGSGDVDWSIRLGRAAFALLDHVIELQLRSGASFIVDAAYDAAYENAKWQRWQQEYGFTAVQVHCVADDDVLLRRMSERAVGGSRHPGHADTARLDEFRASLGDGRAEVLDLAGDVLEYRSTQSGSVPKILGQLSAILG